MQVYNHFGYGFYGDLLTDEQYMQIVRHQEETEYGHAGIELIPFTEDYGGGKDWIAVIFRDLGEAGVYGKLITAEDLIAKQAELDKTYKKDLDEIIDVLDRHGLDSTLIQHVQFIIFPKSL